MAELNIDIPLDRLVSVAVEHWRLTTLMSGGNNPAVNHSLRKLGDFLASAEIEARGLEGQPYDAGLAARVADVVDDPSLEAGEQVVRETLSPMVLHRGVVVKSAEVVIARGSGSKAG